MNMELTKLIVAWRIKAQNLEEVAKNPAYRQDARDQAKGEAYAYRQAMLELQAAMQENAA